MDADKLMKKTCKNMGPPIAVISYIDVDTPSDIEYIDTWVKKNMKYTIRKLITAKSLLKP